MTDRFQTVLVANRGEIAVRVIRTARAMGFATVAVHSDVDADAPHVLAADRAVEIGPATPTRSYLDANAILEAAARTGADAIHPGYGFLSENAEFAASCIEAGIVFIGPSPAAIRLMGDKAQAKQAMRAAKVPCVPGYDAPEQDDESLVRAADAIGYPLLVKATAGGGGRGMRRVETASALREALESARAEARGAFGDGRLMLESVIENARHIEFQVFGDDFGHVIHLGERDCSVQRRHQKVIEEAPSPALDADLRARMGEAAVAAARAVDYAGAGTVEFLLGADGSFYFLEMNTRLQVEHGVTEMVTGLDLLELQLRVAGGEPLALEQAAIPMEGHAIEARLYAEDPTAGFAPQTGILMAWEPPVGIGLRCDAGVRAGLEITPHYDPMLAKLLAHGDDRERARLRLVAALRETVALGVETNRRWLGSVLAHPRFVAGEATTEFVERELRLDPAPFSSALLAAGAVAWTEGPERRAADPWRNSGSAEFPLILRARGESHRCRVLPCANGSYRVRHEDTTTSVLRDSGDGRLCVDGQRLRFHVAWHAGRVHLQLADEDVVCEEVQPGAASSAPDEDANVSAPTAGRVLGVAVAPGQTVRPGDLAAKIESMKIESSLTFAVAGRVSEVRVTPGEAVAAGTVLVAVEPAVEGAEESS